MSYPDRCGYCEYAVKSLGVWDGINMGKGLVRLTTHPECPEHALCQRYTKEYRATQWNGEWLYCNVHRTKNCPEHGDRTDAYT